MKVWKFDRILLTVISNQNSQFQGSNKTVFCYCLCTFLPMYFLHFFNFNRLLLITSLYRNSS